jgi:clan AA aspartic protease
VQSKILSIHLCCALLLSACNGKVLGMGITEVAVEVSNPRVQTHWQKLDLIADTGAIFSVIPRSTLDQLGITPYAEETFHLADGSEIRRPMGDVFIRIDGKARTVPTIFGEPTDTPLLGVTALEILGYAIDPRTRKLEPTKMLLL